MSLELCDVSLRHKFLGGELSAQEELAFVQHLDQCPDCRTHLEEEACPPPLWAEAQQSLQLIDSESGVLSSGRPLATLANPALDEVPVDSTILDWKALLVGVLSPSDDPRMIGRIGTYEICGLLGVGGMGWVLKALDRALNRFVAIKVLTPHWTSNANARQRFAREAQAAAAVVHEHIVPIYAVDEQNGVPYLVMRYVPGKSLQQRLQKSGPLSLAAVLRIGLQVARGLEASHAQGLVHRDIKPANILIESTVDRVLLSDFGLARTMEDSSLTQTGVIAGTPLYMSPEQARGDQVDARTDLFSLGCVLYEICTGQPPFKASTTMGILNRICQDTPLDVRQLNPHIPANLAAVIRKLLQKKPWRRFESAGEVAQVLEAQLAELQLPGAKRPPLLRAALTFCKDHAVAACLAALVCGGIYWSGLWPDSPGSHHGPGTSSGISNLASPELAPEGNGPDVAQYADGARGESQPGDRQPDDRQPAESQPDDRHPDDQQPGDSHAGHCLPASTQPADNAPETRPHDFARDPGEAESLNLLEAEQIASLMQVLRGLEQMEHAERRAAQEDDDLATETDWLNAAVNQLQWELDQELKQIE